METVIDWSKAPEWSGAVVKNRAQELVWVPCFGGVCAGQWLKNGRIFLINMRNPSGWELVQERPTTWNGEGLPPVGTVCEFAAYHGGDPAWKECKVIAHDDGFAVIAYKGNYSGQSNSHLRPIRTAEQISAEEALADIERLYSEGGPAAVFDAGYRKQVQP